MTPVRPTPTLEPIRMVEVPEHVVGLALHVIESDPRRTPYGHHQHWRGDAIGWLRDAQSAGKSPGE